MNAYMYQADIYCEGCVDQIKAELRTEIEDQAGKEVAEALARLGIEETSIPEAFSATTEERTRVLLERFECESDYDSDEHPKGPYSDGGGESDSPQHCASCGTFLENPLTDEGVEYVRESGNREWADFYDIELDPESVGPEEGDITSSDGLHWYQYGKLVLVIEEDDDRNEKLIEFMDKSQFWPNCWNISYHGNCHLIYFE